MIALYIMDHMIAAQKVCSVAERLFRSSDARSFTLLDTGKSRASGCDELSMRG